jgi:hypothetical protein
MGRVVLGQLSSEFGVLVPVTIPPAGYKINIFIIIIISGPVSDLGIQRLPD